ncbi:hypothetical protein DL96DRAFT_1589467 [Flagelloscypha sp. PMI_526]|nr:hypothetical protein DL96DRAFT_1589467 [Flagelloscypha sp. PMI_526]
MILGCIQVQLFSLATLAQQPIYIPILRSNITFQADILGVDSVGRTTYELSHAASALNPEDLSTVNTKNKVTLVEDATYASIRFPFAGDAITGECTYATAGAASCTYVANGVTISQLETASFVTAQLNPTAAAAFASRSSSGHPVGATSSSNNALRRLNSFGSSVFLVSLSASSIIYLY